MPLVECFLREQRMGFAMSKVTRRRSDELGNLVRVLKLGAVDLDTRMWVAEQRLRHCLDYAGLA